MPRRGSWARGNLQCLGLPKAAAHVGDTAYRDWDAQRHRSQLGTVWAAPAPAGREPERHLRVVDALWMSLSPVLAILEPSCMWTSCPEGEPSRTA